MVLNFIREASERRLWDAKNGRSMPLVPLKYDGHRVRLYGCPRIRHRAISSFFHWSTASVGNAPDNNFSMVTVRDKFVMTGDKVAKSEGQAPPTDRTRRLRAVAVAAALTLAAFIIQVLVGVTVGFLSVPLGADVASLPMTLLLIVLGQFVFFLVAYVYVKKRDIGIPLSMPDRNLLGLAALGAASAFALAMLGMIVMELTGAVPGSAYEDTAADASFLIGFAVISTFIVAPVEEFLFRGVIQGRLRKSMGAPASIAIASLLFGSVHSLNYTGPLEGVLAGMLLIVAVGAILGLIYEKTGNLWAPVLGHAAYNLAIIAASSLAL